LVHFILHQYMILFLYGKDTFRSRHRLNQIIAEFQARRDPSGYNVTRLDAIQTKPDVIIGELYNAPFLAEKRMVVIEYALESKHTPLHEHLGKIIDTSTHLPDTTVCVLYERIDTHKETLQKKILKSLSAHKFAHKFDLLKGADLIHWITKTAHEIGLTIESSAVHYIATQSKGDTWLIHSLLAQLHAYHGQDTCTEKTVRLFLHEVADDNIFTLIDSIVHKKSRAVYAMIRAQYEAGFPASYIFSMLIRQFKIMLQIKDILDSAPSTSPDQLAKMIGVHPFVAKKTLPSLRIYPTTALKEAYQTLLDIDIAQKTGKGSLPVMLDMFVGKLCTT